MLLPNDMFRAGHTTIEQLDWEGKIPSSYRLLAYTSHTKACPFGGL
jgi:hypothetical protein